MVNRTGPVTAEEIARNGHIAALIRQWLAADKDRDIGRINAAMGRPRGAPNAYTWLHAKGAPNGRNRIKLAKVLGVPVEALVPRQLEGQPQAVATHNRTVAHAVAVAMPSTPARQADLLTFSVAGDGTARLRLDVTLPAPKAVALLQMVLTAGLVLTQADDAA